MPKHGIPHLTSTLCPQKTSTFLFFNNSDQKLTDFNNVGMLNPEKI